MSVPWPAGCARRSPPWRWRWPAITSGSPSSARRTRSCCAASTSASRSRSPSSPCRRAPATDRRTRGPWDLALIALALAATAYPVLFLHYFLNRMYYVDDPTLPDLILGYSLVVLVLEATRRAVGIALPATAAVFIVYALTLGDQSPLILIDQLYLTTEGIFGIPAGVSATYVILFIIFGALVERTGTGKLFIDFALALTGHQTGGPAKVACVTSGLFGTVSGSAVANVMTTGTFTIPLMRKIGYRPSFAGAVEAVASTGGQIMPPIMGAAAFVMAEFLGVSYLHVAAAALIPAVLYFLAVFMSVHFEARRTGMRGLRARRAAAPRPGAARARPPVPAARDHHRRAAGRLQRALRSTLRHSVGRSDRAPAPVLARIAHLAHDRRRARGGRPQQRRGGARLRLRRDGGRRDHAHRPRHRLHPLRARGRPEHAAAGAGPDHGGRHRPRHGHADHARLHRPGGAAGAGDRQARGTGRGGAHVRLLLRDPLGDHAAGGARGLRRQQPLGRRPVADRDRRAQARRHRLHHPVHVRVRPVAA